MNTTRDIIQFMKLMGFENKTGLDSSELKKELFDQWWKFSCHGPRDAGRNGVSGIDTNTDSNTKTPTRRHMRCQRSPHIRKTVYDHQCTGCKCKTVYARKNHYLGFPELQVRINAIGTVLRDKFAINVQP